MKKKNLSPEQIRLKAERQERFRAITKRIAEMDDDQRDELAASLPLIMTCEGHPLSPRNTMLLHFQSATPCTLVGGFRQWIKQGRVVRKGQHGMSILFPCLPGEKPNESDTDQASETAATAANGHKERTFFAAGSVFDISQTEELISDKTDAQDHADTDPNVDHANTLTIWNSNGTQGPALICAPPREERASIMNRPPPGGWTEADKVPAKYRKPITPQVPPLDGMSPCGFPIKRDENPEEPARVIAAQWELL